MKITFRTWILIIVLLLSLLAISPRFSTEGVAVRYVERNSSAYENGMRSGMVIYDINEQKINTKEEFSNLVQKTFISNQTQKIVINTDGGEIIFLANSLPIEVDNLKKTKIKTGLDLSGGARAIVKPVNVSLSEAEMNDLVAITNNRLNAFGISDVNVRGVSDLTGNRFMLVEVAGATQGDLRELVGKQGKFEAMVGNKTVFEGGERDVSDVCRRAECSGITQCVQVQGGYSCEFTFTIFLTEEAAKKHADATRNLSLDPTGRYLNESLYLYVDENLMDTLLIGTDLKGQVATQISIRGSGSGNTQNEAYDDAVGSMNKLQTILLTGSLPYKLEIVKMDSVSPTLGEQFTLSLIYLGLLVFAIISVSIYIKYRNLKLTGAVILTMFSEAFITLGIAAFIGWNLDAPSIAGIIAGMGTGVNDQIVILDEATTKDSSSTKERVKRALFIIMGAFFTIVAAMLPLFWAGAGLLRGFALTTILGVSVGILITRPAFADIVKKIEGQ